MTIKIVDLDAPPETELAEASLSGALMICHCSDPETLAAGEKWTEQATLTLVGFPTDDVRAVTVTDVDAEIKAITECVSRYPLAAQICDDVLRANANPSSLEAGLTVESLAYSTLQAGGVVVDIRVPPPAAPERGRGRTSARPR